MKDPIPPSQVPSFKDHSITYVVLVIPVPKHSCDRSKESKLHLYRRLVYRYRGAGTIPGKDQGEMCPRLETAVE